VTARGVVADRARAWSADGGDTGVLMLHGFTGNPAALRPPAERLADAGFAVELPRLPGHGTHWRDLAGTTWHDWAAAADAAFERLRARTRQTAVFGLSVGGTLALLLAQRRPADVGALVLINPGIAIGADHLLRPLLPVARVLDRVLPPLPGVANDIARPGPDELAYPKVPLRAAASLIALQEHVRGDLDRVTAPLLVCTSQVDHVVDPHDSAIILDGVGSPHTEQVWLERSFHVATLDYDADLIVERTLGFLRTALHTGPDGRPEPTGDR
jgi:carboxylesterase